MQVIAGFLPARLLQKQPGRRDRDVPLVHQARRSLIHRERVRVRGASPPDARAGIHRPDFPQGRDHAGSAPDSRRGNKAGKPFFRVLLNVPQAISSRNLLSCASIGPGSRSGGYRALCRHPPVGVTRLTAPALAAKRHMRRCRQRGRDRPLKPALHDARLTASLLYPFEELPVALDLHHSGRDSNPAPCRSIHAQRERPACPKKAFIPTRRKTAMTIRGS